MPWRDWLNWAVDTAFIALWVTLMTLGAGLAGVSLVLISMGVV